MYPALHCQGYEPVAMDFPSSWGLLSCSDSLPFDGCSGHSWPCEWPVRGTVHSTWNYVLFFRDRPAHVSLCQDLCTFAAAMQDVYPGGCEVHTFLVRTTWISSALSWVTSLLQMENGPNPGLLLLSSYSILPP